MPGVINRTDFEKLPYYYSNRMNIEAGDVLIKLDNSFTPTHCALVDRGRESLVHSIHAGVQSGRMPSSRYAVWRFQGEHQLKFHPGYRAAQIAEGWANSNIGYTGCSLNNQSWGQWRAVIAKLGSSKFEKNAKNRLKKYRKRQNFAPKNMICSELVILAYQLSGNLGDGYFIEIDAKHATPPVVEAYLNKSKNWSPVFRVAKSGPSYGEMAKKFVKSDTGNQMQTIMRESMRDYLQN